MGSGCTKNNTVKHCIVPSFYVANASRFRIMVYTSDSELSSLGSEATTPSGENDRKCAVSTRELRIGEYCEFFAKFFAICCFDGAGDVDIKHPRLNQSTVVYDGKSVIITEDKIFTSGNLSSRGPEKQGTEETSLPLERKVWTSAADNKDLRPRDFYVANVSGQPIFVLQSTLNAAGKCNDPVERKVEHKQVIECRGESVVIFASDDHKTEIRRSDVSPRKLILVVGQAEGQSIETPQLEGDERVMKEIIEKAIDEALPKTGFWTGLINIAVSTVVTPEVKQLGEFILNFAKDKLKQYNPQKSV